jgi:predicted helicase
VHKVLSHTYGDLYGSCSAKYQVLLARTASDLASLCLTPVPEFHLFVPVDDNAKGAYDISVSVPDIFNQNGDPAPGMVTTQDEFAVSFTKQEAKEKIELLLNTNSEQEARSHFRLCKQAQWDYSNAKRELANGDWRKKVVPLMYRPFDFRWTVYDRNVAVHRRERASRHMLKPNNIALITTRAVEIQGGFSHVFVSTLPIQHHTVSLKEVNYIFPLYLHPSDQEVHSGLYEEGDVRPNVDPLYCATLCCLLEIPSTTPNDVFAYVYAILHSNLYRAYFADFFRTDYPRIPYCKTMKLYTSLCTTGASLLKVHTMASYTDIPTDALNGDIGCSPFNGSPFRDISKGFPKYVNGAVLINENGAGFLMVSEGVWDFCIGGYQVCEKWLKDRRGRTLTDEDIEHYQKIVVAIKETIRLMGEIDNVIEEHGGFPGAFVTDPKIIDEAKAKAKTISPF